MPNVHIERSRTGKSVYLDFQATTPVDPRVLDAMLPYEINKFGNAHSRTHMYGWEGEEAVDEAREVRERRTHSMVERSIQ